MIIFTLRKVNKRDYSEIDLYEDHNSLSQFLFHNIRAENSFILFIIQLFDPFL